MQKSLTAFFIGIICFVCLSYIAISNAQSYDSTCDEFYVGQRIDINTVVVGISPEKGLLTTKYESWHTIYDDDRTSRIYNPKYYEYTCKRALQIYNSNKSIFE
jgi:hypothetical protein